MENLVRLHTATRKYCIDLIKNIKQKYNEVQELANNIYTADNVKRMLDGNDEHLKQELENLNTLCNNFNIHEDNIKISIIEVILSNIETIDSETFDLKKLSKDFIKNLYKDSEISDKISYSIPKEHIIDICNKEKEKLDKFIDEFIEDDLSKFDTLFYRKCISKNEAIKIKDKLMKVLKESFLIKNKYRYLKEESFRKNFDEKILIQVLKERKECRIYEINTGGINSNSYVMDMEALDLNNSDVFDVYWCSEDFDWIIEKNHEGWYIIYGKWLIVELRKLYPYDDNELKKTVL